MVEKLIALMTFVYICNIATEAFFPYRISIFVKDHFDMQILDKNKAQELFTVSKEFGLCGRWITFDDIKNLLLAFENNQNIHSLSIGFSENGIPIYNLQIGNGDKKILIWTQMHGNESTGTKAIFDLLNLLNQDILIVEEMLSACTISIIPMLNPDGALRYTIANAKGIDLNRDAVGRVAIESNVLRNHLEEFQPDFCFNLHDQRTIFGVEGTTNPATISFLAPSEDETRYITVGRQKAMYIITAMNQLLQTIIPHHIGRYTDEFYPTATGDNFQKLGFHTILIESGHYHNDYHREETRRFTFFAILQGVYSIAKTAFFNDDYQAYFNIPNNNEIFFDVVKRFKNKEDEVYQYKEQIVDNQLKFIPKKIEGVNLKRKLFHNENDFLLNFYH